MKRVQRSLLGCLIGVLLILPNFAKSQESTKAESLWGPSSGKIVTFDLKQCFDRALNHNRELEVADSAIKTAQEKQEEVRKIGYPIVDYEYNVGPAPRDVSHAMESFFTGDLTVFNKFRVGVGVPLQTFGKVGTGRELAALGVEAEREKKVQKKSEIVTKVAQVYNGILLSREIRRLIKTARDELLKRIQEREVKEGGDPSELLKMKLFHAELERRVEEIDKREIMAHEALGILINIDPSVRFDIRTDRLRPTERSLAGFEKYRNEAVKNRSDLKQVGLLYQVRKKQVGLEKRIAAPNLGLGAFFEMGRTPGVTGVTTTDDFSDPFNFTRAGMGLRLTGQFDFHGTAAKIRQAKSELYKAEIQKELAQSGAVLEVKEAYLDLQSAQHEIERSEEAGKLSRQLLFLTQSNFDIGLAEPKDLIDALKSFLETRGKYFEAVFNYNVTVAKLDQRVGRIPE